MFTKSNRQKSGFSVISTEELYAINGGDGNATQYTYPDGTYMIVSNDGSFETKIYNPDGSEKTFKEHFDFPIGNAIPMDVNYDPDTGKVTNPLSDSVNPNNGTSHSGGSSGGSSGRKS